MTPEEQIPLLKSIEDAEIFPIFITSNPSQVILGSRLANWSPREDANTVLEWIVENLPLETRQVFFELIMRRAAELLSKL